MQFQYLAKNSKGGEREGVRSAADHYDLGRQLKKEGYILVSYSEKDTRKRFSFSDFGIGGVSTAEKMIFARNMSALIGAGIPLSRAIDVLNRQTDNKAFRTILINISKNIQKGTQLSENLGQYPKIFSPLFVAMVRVGEESGTLGDTLALIGRQLERENDLKKRVRGALIYPSIIIFAMVLVGILMMIFVVPSLVATFAELSTELPLSTKVIIFLSGIITGHPILSIVALLGATAGVMWSIRSRGGRQAIGAVMLKLPVFSKLIRHINSARTSRTLASLIKGGVSMLDALAITEDVLQYNQYKKVIREARTRVEKGKTLSGVFSEFPKLYPPLVSEMMMAGEESGSLADMLMRLADFYESEVEEATKNLATIIEPVLFLIIGAAVGFFAISMITPMYSVLNNI